MTATMRIFLCIFVAIFVVTARTRLGVSCTINLSAEGFAQFFMKKSHCSSRYSRFGSATYFFFRVVINDVIPVVHGR